VRAELLRKSIHCLIALVPLLASFDYQNTALLLIIGIFIYTTLESLRYLGFYPPFIASITTTVLRKREQGHFALAPVTLGLGALLSLILFSPTVSAISIYVLAFGDTAGTMAGKFIGRIRPKILLGKSIEGSIACFTASSLAAYMVIQNWQIAVIAGITAFFIDMLPLGDMDNILMPLAAGFACLYFTV